MSDDPIPNVRLSTAEPAPTTDAKGAAYGNAAFAIIHSFPHALATTTRSTLELLPLPFPFSQNFLLDANDLLRRVAERRIKMWADRDLNMSGLEELHRQALLVPFYGVDLGPIDPAKVIDVSTSETWRQIRSTHLSQLYAAATEGRLNDPAQEAYEPWPTVRERNLWPSVKRWYLYSPHQLLALNRIRAGGTTSPGRAIRRLEGVAIRSGRFAR